MYISAKLFSEIIFFFLTLTVLLYIFTDMKNKANKYSLNEICILCEVTKRTLRFYIQEGLIDRPEGHSKRAAYYTKQHLEQLLTVLKYRQAGVSLERIKEIIHDETQNSIIPPVKPNKPGTIAVWSHLFINNGIELHIEPSKAGLSPEKVRIFTKKVMDMFQKLKKEE